MYNYDDTAERLRYLDDSIQELSKVNKQLAKLLLRKEELTNSVISTLGHEHDGQKTYEHGVWKIEVKTPYVYSLDKKMYESCNSTIPDNFNPIKTSKSYTVDKRLCEKYINEAPKKVQKILVDLISKKPGKPLVTIKERV